MKHASVVAFAFSFSFAGCVVTAESSFHDKALARASFELGCPANQLEIGVLHRNDGLGCAGSQVAVMGCGKKAVYTCDRSQSWVNESGVLPR